MPLGRQQASGRLAQDEKLIHMEAAASQGTKTIDQLLCWAGQGLALGPEIRRRFR
jgi:hypothetical protein